MRSFFTFKQSEIGYSLGLFVIVSVALLGLTGLLVRESSSDSILHPAQVFLKKQKLKMLEEQKLNRIKSTIKKAQQETDKLY